MYTQGVKRKRAHKELELGTQRKQKTIIPTSDYSVPATLKKAVAKIPPRTQEPRMTKEVARERVGDLIHAMMQQSSISTGNGMSSTLGNSSIRRSTSSTASQIVVK